MSSRTLAQIQIPLDIPEVRVVSTEITREGELLIQVESEIEWTICGICGKEIPCTFGCGQEVRLRHLSVLGLETYICIRPRRGQCKHCWQTPTTTQVLDWYEQRSPHTKAYDRYLLKQLLNSTIEDVSLKEHVGYDAVEGALNRQVAAEVDWDEIEDLNTIGIDEIALRKGRKDYAAIITARQHNGKVRPLAMLSDRKKRV